MTELNSEIMGKVLTQVNVKGLIEEAPLVIDKEGNGSVQALDYSGSLVVSCRGKVLDAPPDKSMSLGLCNLAMLCRFFCGANSSVAFSIKDDWLTLRRQGGRIKTLLQDITTMPTKIENEVSIKQFTKESQIQFTIDQQFVDKLSYYVNLLSSNSVVFAVKNGQLSVRSNEHEEQQFVFSKAAKTTPKDVTATSELFTNQLMPVLEIALSTNENNPPELSVHMGNSTPFVIGDSNNFWALMPVVA